VEIVQIKQRAIGCPFEKVSRRSSEMRSVLAEPSDRSGQPFADTPHFGAAQVGVSNVPPHGVSIVIAADYPVVLCGLNTILRAENDFTVVASCCDIASCIEAIRDLSPNLALLDVSLPGQSGPQILAAIKSENLYTRVVFLSASSEASDGGQSIVIPRNSAPNILLHFLRRVSSGLELSPISESSNKRGHGPGRSTEPPSTVLTERERQIMHVVSTGQSNKEIGRQLNLTEGTVKVHLHHMYQKLAVHNRTALAVLATPSTRERA
jgi:two-component system, NarL family, nitrate/nitrite response regulator NarL